MCTICKIQTMKIHYLLLWLCLHIALLVPAGVQAQLTFTTNNGTITITGYNGNPTVLVIPNSTNGYTVNSIGTNAFYDFTSLTSVTIPNSITSIGANAFWGSGLTDTLTIPSSVTNIGDEAFTFLVVTNYAVATNNTHFASVNGVLFNKAMTTLIAYPCGQFTPNYAIPSTVSNIGDEAFGYCYGLTNVTIPNSVTSIGSEAFIGTELIGNLSIPNTVITIGQAAFGSCSSLTSITISNNLSNIGIEAFAHLLVTNISVASGNLNYASVNGVLFNKAITILIQYSCGLTNANYVIPNTVTNIGQDAFSFCPRLANVTIPSSVSSIGVEAFDNCPSLTSVLIPSSVSSIGLAAFTFCTGCTNFSVVSSNSYYASVGGVLFNKATTTLIQYPSGRTSLNYAIPNSVTNIGDWAFGAAALMSVTLPNQVYSIGDDAFYGSMLTGSLTIPNSVSNIGANAFTVCSGLTNVAFQGNAPTVDGQLGTTDSSIFAGDSGTVNYNQGTSGWGMTFGGWPTAALVSAQPVILETGSSFGIRSNRFSFTISWATNASVIIEACTNLYKSTWTPLATNALSGGILNFSDSKWTNYSRRYYRIQSQ